MSVGNPAFSQEEAAQLLPRIQQENQSDRDSKTVKSFRKRSPSPSDPVFLLSTKETGDREAVESEKFLDEMQEEIDMYRDRLRFQRKQEKLLARTLQAQLRERRALRSMLKKAKAELKKDLDTANVRSILGPRIPRTQIPDFIRRRIRGERGRIEGETDPSVD